VKPRRTRRTVDSRFERTALILESGTEDKDFELWEVEKLNMLHSLPLEGTLIRGPGIFRFDTQQGCVTCSGRIIVTSDGFPNPWEFRLGNGNKGLVAIISFESVKRFAPKGFFVASGFRVLRLCYDRRSVYGEIVNR